MFFVGEGNLIFCCTVAVGRTFSGQSVGKMIIILSFKVGISKNKNMDLRVKKNFCYYVNTSHNHKLHKLHIQQCQVHRIFVFYVFYCGLKENDHIRRNKNSKKKFKKMFICEISIIIILIYRKLGSVGPVQQKN